MKIVIPKVVVAVEMVAYASELAGKFLHVWVNPPRQKLEEYDELVRTLQAREVEKAREVLVPNEQISKGANGQTPLSRAIDQVSHWLKVKRKPEGIDQQLLEWYAQIWSQGPAETQWSLEELRELEDQDPAFLSWMIAQTWKTRTEHIERKKKV